MPATMLNEDASYLQISVGIQLPYANTWDGSTQFHQSCGKTRLGQRRRTRFGPRRFRTALRQRGLRPSARKSRKPRRAMTPIPARLECPRFLRPCQAARLRGACKVCVAVEVLTHLISQQPCIFVKMVSLSATLALADLHTSTGLKVGIGEVAQEFNNYVDSGFKVFFHFYLQCRVSLD